MAAEVKILRERTGAGILDCSKALKEANGDVEKAVELLRIKGLASAGKKSHRIVNEGAIGSYVHTGGKIAVMVEVNCETDFVARTPEFQEFIRDLAMHVAASSPRFVSRDEVSAEFLAKEKEILVAQMKNDEKMKNKPENILVKIVEGKLDKFYSENCLLEQPFVKDPDQTVEQLLKTKIAKTGENIVIRRFVRWQLGETATE